MSIRDDQSHLDRVRAQLELATEISGLLGQGATSSGLAKHVHFKIFRDYIEREDELVNQRVLWNINIQGFLLAGYGFSLQKLAEIQKLQSTCPEMPGKGLLLVTYGLPLQKLAELQKLSDTCKPSLGTGVQALDLFIKVTPWLGLFISGLSFLGVIAALLAIGRLKRDWSKAEREHELGAQLPLTGPRLPCIIGGGSGKTPLIQILKEFFSLTHILGLLTPVLFPVAFMAIWIVLWWQYHFMK